MNGETMMSRICKHGANLKTAFNLPAETDTVKLCKSLRRLENKANRFALDLCNGRISPTEDQELAFTDGIKAKVEKLLGPQSKGKIYYNLDPRGYALKLTEEASAEALKLCNIHRDWGGYVILAPDLREEN